MALVNDTADESSKMLTAKYSIAEVAYFRSLVGSPPHPAPPRSGCVPFLSDPAKFK